MNEQLKQRLVGAAVLVSLAVIFIPVIFGPGVESESGLSGTNIPLEPEVPFDFSALPMPTPATPLLDQHEAEQRQRHETASQSLPGVSSETLLLPDESPDNTPATLSPQASSRASPDGVAEKPKGSGAWAVQIGSFHKTANALALRDRLRDKGYTAFVESVTGGKGKITRVLVGPELDRDEARAAVGKLLKDARLQGIVVKYPGG